MSWVELCEALVVVVAVVQGDFTVLKRMALGALKIRV